MNECGDCAGTGICSNCEAGPCPSCGGKGTTDDDGKDETDAPNE